LLLLLFLSNRPGKESDIWSLGIILFILIEMRFPYQIFYEPNHERHPNIQIKSKIKEGLVKGGKVFCFLFSKKIFFFLIFFFLYE
jgi:serine/threonine protein kinase